KRAHPSGGPPADPTRRPPCWPLLGWPNSGGPASRRRWLPGTVLGRLPAAGVFFTLFGLILEARDLIDQGDIFLSQCLEAPVIFHVLFHLGGLVLRNALGEFLAVEEALENVIRAAGRGGTGRAGAEELFAQGTATKAVNGLQVQQDGLPLLEKVIKIKFHGLNVSIQIQYATTKWASCLLFDCGLLSGHTPFTGWRSP